MTADTVTRTLQEGLEKNAPLRGQPAQVHDRGRQYLSHEWKQFVQGAGLRDIRTRVAHPESNGKVERLHRTHREEGLAGPDLESYGAAVDALAGWVRYYNEARPHAALHYLCPRDYYRGDPDALLVAREAPFTAAALARRAYWEAQEEPGKPQENPRQCMRHVTLPEEE